MNKNEMSRIIAEGVNDGSVNPMDGYHFTRLGTTKEEKKMASEFFIKYVKFLQVERTLLTEKVKELKGVSNE